MNVPILRPIVIRDDPRLKALSWHSRPIPMRARSGRWFFVLGVIVVTFVAASFATVLWASITQTPSAVASQDPTLVYTQLQDGHSQIFTMDSSGNRIRQITSEDANTTQVSWSPDGKHLVFVNDIDGHEQIYRIDATGTRETRLTNDNMRDGLPSWSPVGNEIAYLGIDGSNASIWIMNSDGSGPRKATEPTYTGSILAPLAWAPDGHKLAFASGTSNQTNIMLLTPKTGEVKQLTKLPGRASQPAWSPDGTSLAFTVTTGDGPASRATLYTVNADGSDLKQITSGDVIDARPTWSPDASLIAFLRTTGEQSALFVVNTDGTNPRQISVAPKGEVLDYPSFGPEGQMLLFVRHASTISSDDSATLETIDVHGNNHQTLSTTLTPDSSPLIRPTQ